MRKLLVITLLLVLVLSSAAFANFSGERSFQVYAQVEDNNGMSMAWVESISYQLNKDILLTAKTRVDFPETNFKQYQLNPLDLNLSLAMKKVNLVMGTNIIVFEENKRFDTVYLKLVHSW